jgi:hypothetical protein
MKTSCLAFVVLSSIVAGAQPAVTAVQTALPPPTPYAIAESGANSRVWERYTYERAPDGTIVPKKHRVIELASGLNYFNNGQWTESKEEIDVLPQGGAAATQGQHQVYFPGDIYQGVIQMVTPDGEQLQSRPMGISYDDGNNTVLIAELTNSVGVLVSSNQIVYPNAFTGFKADLVCTYRRGGFECDLVLREQPHPPEYYGLNSQNAKIELLTEFFNTPEPVQSRMGVEPQSGLSDTTLRFGSVIMDHGKAFIVGDAPQADPVMGTPVFKSWLHLAGRTFLVEEVPFPKIASSLQSLPMTAMVDAVPVNSILNKVSPTRLLVPARLAQKDGTPVAQLARADIKQKRGVALDYVAVDVDTNDFTFQADTTYLVGNPGAINFNGVTTFEGGTVVKFETNPDYGDLIQSWDTNVCDTGPYRPAIFTSVNDDTVGEPISEPGTPMNYVEALAGDATTTTKWEYLHIRYANYGIQGNTEMHVSDSQFVNCGYPFFLYWGPGYYTNDLLVNIESAFYGNDFQATAYHLTIDNCTNNQLVVDFWGEDASTVSFVNSLLVNVGTAGNATVTTNFTATVTASSGIFQVVGAGSCYLATNSPYQNAGTTNIAASILADIATKTTYPPVVYSNTTISAATTFSPQAQRDTDTPDLGYHYDSLDYVFGGTEAQSNMTFTAGTAVGWFDAWSGAAYGVILDQDATASFNGTVTSPCWLARYDTVQEGGNGNWTDTGYLAAITAQNPNANYSTDAPQLLMQFTKCSSRPFNDQIFQDYTGYFVVQAKNCEFYGSSGGYDLSQTFSNCLFFRSSLGDTAAGSPSFTMQNCTLTGGGPNSALWLQHWSGTTWPVVIRDCAFDGITNYTDTNGMICDYNSFLTNDDRLPVHGAHDLILTNSYNWQSSWFGNYYLPTNSPLINAGDVTADQVGLYHFTTQTNQVPETNSIVDIGYHYVATDTNGVPLDTNGDGIPDYLEDANGNGLVDSGEIGWNIFGDPGLSVIITRPRNGSSLP